MISEKDPFGAKGRIRLQAFLACCGIGSRRHCEGIIEAGRVSVNGATAKLGDSATARDEVRLDGEKLSLQTKLRYIMLNKPAGYLSSMSDPQGRHLAVDLLGADVKERVYNIGRLDQWSSGLLLFSNDGDLAARLTHPSEGFDKEYEVKTDKEIPEDLYRQFPSGIEIDGQRYTAVSMKKIGLQECRIVLIEGRNREIRKVFENFQIRALSLRRVRVGPVLLGNLQEGEWRYLSESEVESLKSFRGGGSR